MLYYTLLLLLYYYNIPLNNILLLLLTICTAPKSTRVLKDALKLYNENIPFLKDVQGTS